MSKTTGNAETFTQDETLTEFSTSKMVENFKATPRNEVLTHPNGSREVTFWLILLDPKVEEFLKQGRKMRF